MKLLVVPSGHKAVLVADPPLFVHREYVWELGEPGNMYKDGSPSYHRELVTGDPEATLRGSKLRDRTEHAPLIDLDVPAQLVPSSTEGHSHLYINVAMSWRKYKRILKALKKAGVIEASWYNMCRKDKQTWVRIRKDKKL